ncbi:NAD(P)-binding Rossmann-like domain protein [Leptospira inadai serovar Lyme str. 10]|uniref:NAD(P)-binding Rossmann-like domain protein n=2 Tax=Leptospira inadai serovar Lyme TaxID=293084 RepID=V6H9R2_9LEPT|nr:NAD(P)-binding Rossmann-like domain protein [Leptospira inadai serovar Lyme str. 10]PNV76792.1 NADP transhydrogenase subunit alpha [Leptospira inadai serovar Lyme]
MKQSAPRKRATGTASRPIGRSKPKLAIIGSGVAGLGCAHFLKDEFRLTIFEKADYIGGHSNTVMVDEGGNSIPIDTGFIVFNHVTYPNLRRLFEDLKVPTKKTSMSFSVQHVPERLEFCGSGLNGLFAQRKNLINFRFLRLLLNINRFNSEAPAILDDPKYMDYSLDRYIREEGYHPDILQYYLVPMSSAVWSTPQESILEFPAYSLVRFFLNHGFLGLNTQHQWYTVEGGSKEYVKRLTAPIKEAFRLKTPVIGVEPTTSGKVKVFLKGGKTETFDKVILASHADTSLKLLKKPTSLQKELLSQFSYQRNIATLHTDDSVMPRKKSTWSSWNYRMDSIAGKIRPHTIYWMNSLQDVSKKKNYYVSIGDPGKVISKKIIREIEYEHPLFHVGSLKAQRRLSTLNEGGPIYFCGSYFRYGFHEDAFWSAKILSEALLGRQIWA